MARFNHKKARRQDTVQTGDKGMRFDLMKRHEREINASLKAHLATNPTEPFDLVVAHRGDLVGVKFHEALAAQGLPAMKGDVGVFVVTRAQILEQLDIANPDVAASLRDAHPTEPTVVCFAFQGTTIYFPNSASGEKGVN